MFDNMILSFDSEGENFYHPDILLTEGDNIMEFEAEVRAMGIAVVR